MCLPHPSAFRAYFFCEKKNTTSDVPIVDSALDELHGANRTEEKDRGDLGGASDDEIMTIIVADEC